MTPNAGGRGDSAPWSAEAQGVVAEYLSENVAAVEAPAWEDYHWGLAGGVLTALHQEGYAFDRAELGLWRSLADRLVTHLDDLAGSEYSEYAQELLAEHETLTNGRSDHGN